MITLNLKRENYWLDLISGVRVHVRPASTALVMAARVAALKEEAEPALRSTALIKRLAQLAIIEWDGVGGEDGEAFTRQAAIGFRHDEFGLVLAFGQFRHG